MKNSSAAVRSKGEIVINVASSGIASLLLPGGRTAHSRFGLPINVHESSTRSISQQSPHAELLIRVKLIIWDEAPMMHRYCFEALDKTMKSILQADKPFGGKVVVLGGDFRQILPVVLKASRQDIVHATINSSPLWNFCRVMKLTKNMRLQSCSSPSNMDEIKEFGDWILNVGNGDVGEDNDGEASIEIPNDMLIGDSEDPFRDLLEFVYPDLLSNMYDRDYFQGRAILARTNECVESVNDHLMSILPAEDKVYLSSDSMCRDEHTTEDNAEIYSTEFLNTIRCSGVPSHALRIKVGTPVMLIRNIDQARGLCNGTRLQIIRTGIHVLSCKILSGKNIGDMVFIPRMTLIPSNSGLPIKFQRRQFPLIVSFAMTINKSQGQTLSHVGLYLSRPVFSHGQLYVAVSRVKSRGGIKIFIKSDSGELTNVTRNVVYKEVFHRI
ncbi:PREDICTED: ATP-dependent DNA helicase PIF1-like [Erythranthe guttata]|uniref:ATP-dependent DNA helicase PIF1-like n=1 Tax=Erythranthe guttata TaxID=4155 RepID=UPI00064DF436|nr:PREDICTED: ATP-dependent DNA helicase PIF1-like [Erythranthe guttata]|eukprot:XP_012834082.1 PREDICTED: ATP-dependent DNA helicase PIF1-like [Erythranthe guttata]